MASPVFDGAREDDIVGDAEQGGAGLVGSGHAGRRAHRRGVRPQGDGRLHLHAEAAPPGRRQDPRPLDRTVQPRHPAAAGRQGAVRRPALRRDGGVGARSLRRGIHLAGDADGQVGRRLRPHQGLRGDRPRRRQFRGRHSRNRSTCWSRSCARSGSMSSWSSAAIDPRSRLRTINVHRCRLDRHPRESGGPGPAKPRAGRPGCPLSRA